MKIEIDGRRYNDWTMFVRAEMELAGASRLRDILDACRLAACDHGTHDAADPKWNDVEKLLEHALDELPADPS